MLLEITLHRTRTCREEIRSALMTESAKVSEIAAKHGFTFTSEEGEQAWDRLKTMNSATLSWIWLLVVVEVVAAHNHLIRRKICR